MLILKQVLFRKKGGTVYFPGNRKKQTKQDFSSIKKYENYFTKSPLPLYNKIQNIAKYIRRQDLARLLVKNELFKLQKDINGSVIECGCHLGGGLMAFAQFSAIYEPYNHTRKIIGFDTFKGFPTIHKKDIATGEKKFLQKGHLSTFKGIEKEIAKSIKLFDENRFIGHIPKIESVIGDAVKKIPQYIKKNPHLIVSLLYLDFDLYEPTKVAIENFVPRMPKGAVLAFDELNTESCPGETIALLETLGINKLTIKRFAIDPYISYCLLE